MALETFARQSLAQFIIIYGEIFDDKVIKPSDLEHLMWGRMCAKEANINKLGFKIPYDNIRRSKVTLPYLPDDINYTGCSAIKKNGGLYTPCCGKIAEDAYYCKTCSVDKEGEVKDLEFGDVDSRDRNVEDERFAPITFGEWMKGHKMTLSEVYAKLAAGGVGIEIPAEQLMCRELPKRRKGRPAKSEDSVVDEDTKPKRKATKADSDSEEPKAKAKKASPAASESETEKPKKAKKVKEPESESEEAPPPKKASPKPSPKASPKASPAASESETEKPKKKASPKASPAASESETEKPKKAIKKASPAASESDTEKPKKATKKTPEPEPESESEEEAPAPKKAAKAEKVKAKPKDKAEKADKAKAAKEPKDKAEKPKKAAKEPKADKAKEPKAKKAAKVAESDSEDDEPQSKPTKAFKASVPEIDLEQLAAGFEEDEENDDVEAEIDGGNYIIRNNKYVCSKEDGTILGKVDGDEVIWNSDKR
jgi:hypothetical protein